MLDHYIHNPQLQQEFKHITNNDLYFFIERLELKGYATNTIHDYLGSVLHFSRWWRLKDKTDLKVTDISCTEFITTHLPNCHCPHFFPRNKHTVKAALHRWINIVMTQTTVLVPVNKTEQLVLQFDDYLANVIGISVATRLYRCHHVSDFLQSIGLYQLTTLNQNAIADYLHQRTINLAPASSAAITDSINQFLKYIFSHTPSKLNHALHFPRPKVFYNSSIKPALTDKELRTLLNSFDRTKPVGKRDYAMVRCLSDLGLRTNAVATLLLDDINWYHNVITLHQTKTRYQQKLPMPKTLIDALTDYLCYARPKTKVRAVFVHHRAPRGDAVSASTVRGAIRRVFARANFPASESQVHRLRYTMATRLLKNGQTIKTIADILGHRCIDTSIRYTTIEYQALCRVALPWPGREAS